MRIAPLVPNGHGNRAWFDRTYAEVRQHSVIGADDKGRTRVQARRSRDLALESFDDVGDIG